MIPAGPARWPTAILPGSFSNVTARRSLLAKCRKHQRWKFPKRNLFFNRHPVFRGNTARVKVRPMQAGMQKRPKPAKNCGHSGVVARSTDRGRRDDETQCHKTKNKN